MLTFALFRSSLVLCSVVTIKVGPEEKLFVVHQDLICHFSKYFNAAFNGSFAEATSKEINLPDVEVQIFEIFVGWLYMQKLDVKTWESKEYSVKPENAI